MNKEWKKFTSRLLAQHATAPQVETKLTRALALCEEGLRELAQHGHLFHLAPGPQPEVGDFPKLLFHATSAPNGRLVASEWEEADLGPGWFPSREAAFAAEGEYEQMRGRGGASRGGLPALLEAQAPVEKRLAERAEAWKALRELPEYGEQRLAAAKQRLEGEI